MTGSENHASAQASARRYRERAEEVRTIAADAKDAMTRGTLLKIADDYDRMSRTWEDLARREAERRP